VVLDTTDNEGTAKELKAILAESHHNLGCSGSESNQPEITLLHFRRLNELMVADVDGKKQKTDNRLAISWNELGVAYTTKKLWEDGERCFKESSKIAQQLTNFAPAEFSFPCVNLGLAYWLTGRLDEAKKTLEEGLRQRFAAYGYDDKVSFV
jgi:tetratricopeptide (TPR) repeat protein